jgi:hypothetical protein
MVRQPRRFVPRLEPFDERALPSVTIDLFPDGTLQIVGDDANNVISISDSGKPDAGSVIVQADGGFYVADGPVTRIRVVTLGGDDTVDYQLSSDVTSNRTVQVELGLGNDAFTAHLDGQNFAAGTDFLVQALGEGGKDRLTLDARGVNLGAGTRFTVDFRGGHGKDSIAFNYSPGMVDPTAMVSLTADQKIR